MPGTGWSRFPGSRCTSPGPPTRPSSRTPRAVTCFWGYAIGLGGQTILHSGDTIPFDGQAAEIAALTPDLALLPVNGRDARRAGHGIAGNLTASEAMALAEAAGVPEVIAHHFGMFAFNTAAPRDLAALSAQAGSAKVRPARPGVTYLLRPDSPPEDQEAR